MRAERTIGERKERSEWGGKECCQKPGKYAAANAATKSNFNASAVATAAARANDDGHASAI